MEVAETVLSGIGYVVLGILILGAIVYFGAGFFAFHSIKNPLKWLAMSLWGGGMFFMNYDVFERTEWVCRNELQRCPAGSRVQALEYPTVLSAVPEFILSGLFVAMLVVPATLLIHDKLSEYYRERE